METTEARKKANRKYADSNCKMISLQLNYNTDKDIISKLLCVDNRQGYIKALIRKDLGGES